MIKCVGLGVTCSPRDPRFASSSPAEVDGFFQDVKIVSTGPAGKSAISGSLKNLKPEKKTSEKSLIDVLTS